MANPKTHEQLRTEKERAKVQHAQAQRKLQRLISEVNRKTSVPKRYGCKTVLRPPAQNARGSFSRQEHKRIAAGAILW